MNVLGIHDGHNAAAALLCDGRIIAAIQEERLTGVKNHDCFPTQAARRVLDIAGCAPEQLDVIALNGYHQPAHRTRAQLIEHVKNAGSEGIGAMLKQMARSSPINTFFRGLRKMEREKEAINCGLPADRITFIEHHEAHAAAAYWGSPWRNTPVLILTCDGAGDDLCATVNVAQGDRIERRFKVAEEHSIGMVYLTVTQLLGMTPNEHEYKVMGLAPYARESHIAECFEIFSSLMAFESGGIPQWRRHDGVPHAFGLYNYLRERLEGFRFDVISAALQRWTEIMLCGWTRLAIASAGIMRVALSGGVFMNVKANKAIADLDEVEELFIVPSCGDESNAVGAALAAYAARRSGDLPAPEPIRNVYWGEEFSEAQIEEALKAGGEGLTVHRPQHPAEIAADLLQEGEIVARFDGRAEFGARSLGNRSLLADPARIEAVRRLNDAIKCRDFWMPFAPTVLAERADDYLINPKHLSAPYMIQAFDTNAAHRSDIHAAMHPYDSTIRPQILERDQNPGYYDLIKAFERRTGRGALLNTSFNLHGFPMVYSPSDALHVLRESGLKWLLMGPFLIEKI